MTNDWKKQLEHIKQETKDEIRKGSMMEKELRQKYEGLKEKLLEMIQSQLVPVVETFRDKNQNKVDQPKIEKTSSSISLRFPIKSGPTTLHLSIEFGFVLTDNGYAVTTRTEDFDFVQQRGFKHDGRIDPPITVTIIQSKIAAYIQNRPLSNKTKI